MKYTLFSNRLVGPDARQRVLPGAFSRMGPRVLIGRDALPRVQPETNRLPCSTKNQRGNKFHAFVREIRTFAQFDAKVLAGAAGQTNIGRRERNRKASLARSALADRWKRCNQRTAETASYDPPHKHNSNSKLARIGKALYSAAFCFARAQAQQKHALQGRQAGWDTTARTAG